MIINLLYKVGLIFLLSIALTSCGNRHAHFVRDGMLRYNIPTQAFLEIWGEPDRIVPVLNEKETTSIKWGITGVNVAKGNNPLVKWTYDTIGIELFFKGNGLAYWKTAKTVKELQAYAKPVD